MQNSWVTLNEDIKHRGYCSKLIIIDESHLMKQQGHKYYKRQTATCIWSPKPCYMCRLWDMLATEKVTSITTKSASVAYKILSTKTQRHCFYRPILNQRNVQGPLSKKN